MAHKMMGFDTPPQNFPELTGWHFGELQHMLQVLTESWWEIHGKMEWEDGIYKNMFKKKKNFLNKKTCTYTVYIYIYIYMIIYIYMYMCVWVQRVSKGNGMKIDFKHDAFKHLEFQRHFDVGNDRIKYSSYVDSCSIMR
jgi:hypothetical protein